MESSVGPASGVITQRPEGLYCEQGNFYIDPWLPVENAIITHAHADHARVGNARYIAQQCSVPLLQTRLGTDIAVTGLAYGESISKNGVQVSLHPAGHVLGSAQVRIAARGEVWVVSGDYKLHADPTCAPFEPLKCDVFVTEATFGLPIYRWPTNHEVVQEINNWWRGNAAVGKPSVLFAYAFGKAQRILASVDSTIGPLLVHGAVDVVNQHYREQGVALPSTFHAIDAAVTVDMKSRALIVAPPSAAGSRWLARFKNYSDGFASGWMQVRGARRRKNVDRGFVLSDHADFGGLMSAIEATTASRIWVTHGNSEVMVRWLREKGYDANAFQTQFGENEVEAASSFEEDALP